MKSSIVLAVCLVQALASPITQPLQSDGDLNMPWFNLLNMALNDGIVDLAPGFARMPPRPNDDLTGAIATFFEEMAFSCNFYGRVEMAESFMALVDVAPGIVQMVELNNVVDETWNFILAMRGEGLAVINLRTFVVDAIKVMESTGKDLIEETREQVNDLKSGNMNLIELKARFKALADRMYAEFAVQVADVAEILRILANQISDIVNNRNLTSSDMMSLFKAYNEQKRDLYDAVVEISAEWKSIEKGLIKIVGSDAVAPITENINELSQLTKKEMIDLGGSLLHTINAARKSYQTMLEIFPYSPRTEK